LAEEHRDQFKLGEKVLVLGWGQNVEEMVLPMTM
jgi:hypothetical protein